MYLGFHDIDILEVKAQGQPTYRTPGDTGVKALAQALNGDMISLAATGFETCSQDTNPVSCTPPRRALNYLMNLYAIYWEISLPEMRSWLAFTQCRGFKTAVRIS